MELALDEAKKAGQIGEVPIGAILVAENGAVIIGCSQPDHQTGGPDRSRRNSGIARSSH